MIAGVAHVGDEADEIIFVRPNIPFRPAVLVQIRSQIAVWKLAFDQFGGDEIQVSCEAPDRPC